MFETPFSSLDCSYMWLKAEAVPMDPVAILDDGVVPEIDCRYADSPVDPWIPDTIDFRESVTMGEFSEPVTEMEYADTVPHAIVRRAIAITEKIMIFLDNIFVFPPF